MNLTKDSGEIVKAKALSEENLSEFLFDIIIQLKVEDCKGLALRTDRYDTKEIKLKKSVDCTPYLRPNPVLFYESPNYHY